MTDHPDYIHVGGGDPSLYNEDLAPVPHQRRNWGAFEIFNVWNNDIQSLFGYTLAALFLGMAFIPALLYLNWFRNFEKHDPEPWGALYQAFFWGAITGIILAGIVNSILIVMVTLAAGAAVAMVVGAVIIAPFVEEFLKAMGLMRAGVKEEVDEVEDGLIYGAACGLGEFVPVEYADTVSDAPATMDN